MEDRGTQPMRLKLSSISHLLRLPSICALCDQYQPNSLPVCPSCFEYFVRLDVACEYCAQPLPEDSFLCCGSCSRKKPHFDCVITAFRFEEPLRTLLHEFKYHSGLYLSRFLAQLMLSTRSKSPETECLMPVPMHPDRLRRRGYNQSAVLATRLGRLLRCPVDLSSCTKVINTASQAELTRNSRKSNLRNSFMVHSLPYKRITLIDDLLTTGSTANELARVLKKQGAEYVEVWCIARATMNP